MAPPPSQRPADIAIHDGRGARGFGWVALTLAFTPLFLRVVGSAFGMDKPADWSTWVGSSWVGAVVLGILALVLSSQMRPRRGAVSADEGGFYFHDVDKTWKLPISQVESAITIPNPTGARLDLLSQSGRTFSAQFVDERAAGEMLESAGLGPLRRRCRIAIGNTFRALGVLASFGVSFFSLAGIAGLAGDSAPSRVAAVTWLLVSVIAFLGSMYLTTAPEMVIGADGFTLHTPFRKRFVSYEGLASVDADRGRLTLRFDDLREETITFFTAPTPARLEKVAAMAARIRDAMDAARTSAKESADVLSLLGRNGRSPSAWRAALAELVSKGTSYRGASLSRVDASRVLESRDANAEQRIGAAIALSAAGDPEAATRIRVAADVCANDRLRVALEKAATDGLDDEAIEDALVEDGVRRQS